MHGVNDVTRVEEMTARLAQGGRAAFVARPTRLHAVETAAEVWGFTQSAWQRGDEADKYTNTDNVLVCTAVVGPSRSLALAVAHGNYKDEGCYLASATARE
jgi:hypothetical protein